jgi:hypothetical protein
MSKAIAELEEQLAYRLPNSGKPLGTIVLTRAQAERLVKEWYELRQRAEEASR